MSNLWYLDKAWTFFTESIPMQQKVFLFSGSALMKSIPSFLFSFPHSQCREITKSLQESRNPWSESRWTFTNSSHRYHRRFSAQSFTISVKCSSLSLLRVRIGIITHQSFSFTRLEREEIDGKVWMSRLSNLAILLLLWLARERAK